MYKYSLHKKSIKHRCPNCEKKRFVLYINNETKEYLNFKVGRCDREISCGYHYKPKQYFLDNDLQYKSKRNVNTIAEVRSTSFHSKEIFNKTLMNYQNNNFIRSLYSNFSRNEIKKMAITYKIGTAYFWYNGTIFWQLDINNKIRGGKIISYQKNGKRTKYINWVHSYLLKQKRIKEFNLKQCFFGEHLINQNNKIIAIVESEKTACIMSMLFDKYLWLASGSLSGLNIEKMKVLKNKKIVLYPDLGINSKNITPYNLWKTKCEEYKNIGYDISISNLLEEKSSREQKEKGLDIADFYIQNNHEKRIKKPVKIKSDNEKIFTMLSSSNSLFLKLVSNLDLEFK